MWILDRKGKAGELPLGIGEERSALLSANPKGSFRSNEFNVR